MQALDQLPADLKARANRCTHKVDVHGKQQLDFCKDNKLLILAILSTRPEGPQRMLDTLQDFSKKRRLTVNLKKTEVLVFEPRRTLCQDFMHGGRVLTRKDSFKYLGLWFHATQWDFRLALGSLAASARKAMHAMRRRCFQLGNVHPQSHVQLQCIGAAHPQLWL